MELDQPQHIQYQHYTTELFNGTVAHSSLKRRARQEVAMFKQDTDLYLIQECLKSSSPVPRISDPNSFPQKKPPNQKPTKKPKA